MVPIVHAFAISRYFQRHCSDWSHKIIVHHAWELQKMLIFSSYQRCAACSRYFIPCILFLYSTRAETIARSSWLSLLISHNIHLSHSLFIIKQNSVRICCTFSREYECKTEPQIRVGGCKTPLKITEANCLCVYYVSLERLQRRTFTCMSKFYRRQIHHDGHHD